MSLDILLVFGIALCQLIVTIYAVWVSVDENKIKTAVVLSIVGAFGIALTVWGAVRSSNSQQKLQDDITELKNDQKNATAGIQKIANNPPVVNVNQPPISFPTVPEHTHAQFQNPSSVGNSPLLPFHENQNVALNLIYTNAGDFTLDDPFVGALLEVVPVQEDPGVTWKKFGSRVRLKFHGGSMVATHNPANDSQFRTFLLDGPLSKGDADDLMAIPAKKKLCAIGKLQWRDASGKFETRCQMCTQREVDGNFTWGTGTENNTERKLSP